MSIHFSMSSQLWFNFEEENIKQFLINSINIDNSNKKKTYSEIFKSMNSF